MKKLLWSWLCVAVATAAVCSCSDDDEYEYSSDCYIKSITLGNVKREVHGKTSAGKDTTYYVTFGGSYYTMSVDQVSEPNMITNKTPLPVGSRTSAILATVDAVGSVVYRKDAEGEQDNWIAYSSSDSIDFSTPLIFRVVAEDGASSREYSVKVNVEQADGEAFTWTKVAESELWVADDTLKLYGWNGDFLLYVRHAGTVTAYSAAQTDGQQWTALTLSGCGGAEVNTLTALAGNLYMSCEDGAVITSADGRTWTAVNAERSVHLFGADADYLYAFSNQTICRSADGVQWTEEVADDDVSLFPTENLASVTYTQGNGLPRLLLAGTRDLSVYEGDAAAVLWGRATDAAVTAPQWIYYSVTSGNPYTCPMLKNLNLLCYDSALMALGGTPLRTGTGHTALDYLYVSRDNGVTWKTSDNTALPDDMPKGDVTVTAWADGEDYLWIVAGRQVWRGRLNRLDSSD